MTYDSQRHYERLLQRMTQTELYAEEQQLARQVDRYGDRGARYSGLVHSAHEKLALIDIEADRRNLARYDGRQAIPYSAATGPEAEVYGE